MKKTFRIAALIMLFAIAVLFVSCKGKDTPAETATEVTTIEDLTQQYYWLMGHTYAQYYASSFEDFDALAFAQGFVDYHYNNERFSAEEQDKIYSQYAFGDNLVAAEEFLKTNKTADGVKETKSGLQYRVDKEGSGSKPTKSSTVNVDYKLTFPDGSVVDQGKGISFPLTGVIAGFAEGLELMTPGSTYTLWIHPDLGYGPVGNSGIPGNQLLIFEVTLNSFEN